MTIELRSALPSLSLPTAEVVQVWNPTRRWPAVALLMAFTTMFFAQLPASYDFANFVFYDPGAALRLDHVVAQGYQPTIDFGYPYGLLTLMIGRAFFAVAGRTPAGYLLFMFLAEAAIVWGIWRLAARWNWLTICFLMAAMPHAIIPVYVHLTHPLEAALILHLLADLAIGRRARALALATACLFIKPSMAYGLGLILLILILMRTLREKKRWTSFASSLLPATLTGVVCITVSVLTFGVSPLINTILPLVGARSYQALDFGLFGNGRTFWWPNLTGAAQYAKYYFSTPAGFWLVCTFLLVIFGLHSLFHLYRRSNEADETVATIAICHLFFLTIFFGWPGSWTYYSSMLVLGAGFGLTVYRVRPALIVALTLLALAGNLGTWKNLANTRQYAKRSTETAGLWAYTDQANEWEHIRALAGKREIYYLNNGCPELLFPNVRGPITFFLSPAMETPKEIERIQQDLEKAEVVVTFNQGPVLDPWHWDEFAKQRAEFVDTWQGKYLTVHERKQQ
ncbi:MAG TPA: hypothetical protein VGB07_13885 [Blastocatellia bacterium]